MDEARHGGRGKGTHAELAAAGHALALLDIPDFRALYRPAEAPGGKGVWEGEVDIDSTALICHSSGECVSLRCEERAG